jgi:hypothetical protein
MQSERGWRYLVGAAAVLLVAGSSCDSGSTVEYACAPGATQACTCTDGRAGSQLCSDDRLGWETCECEVVAPVECTPATADVVCGGGPCVDGYCCDVACDGECMACDRPGSRGTCAPLPLGSDSQNECGLCRACDGSGACQAADRGDDPKDDCERTAPDTCGTNGSCDGSGACESYGVETRCDDGAACTTDDSCDGEGGCAGTSIGCSGHGTCSGTTGAPVCECDASWAEPDCSECADDRYGAPCDACLCVNGVCDDGTAGAGHCLSCTARWAGPDCDIPCACPHGTCDEGIAGSGACAVCDTGWTGTACDECAVGFWGAACAACPVCVHGACDEGIDGGGACVCDSFWTGTLCDVPIHRIFVSSTSTTGAFGGIAGGDAICAACATGAGLSGTWRAILSARPANHAADRLTISGPIFNLNPFVLGGDKVADDAADLWDGSLDAAIVYDEHGIAVASTVPVYTGTNYDGHLPGLADCDVWSATTDYAWAGYPTYTDQRWVIATHGGFTTLACTTSGRLYCLSQP